jgi:hypothetical protein
MPAKTATALVFCFYDETHGRQWHRNDLQRTKNYIIQLLGDHSQGKSEPEVLPAKKLDLSE